MTFTNHKNKLERPYIVYADIEATLTPYKHERKGNAKGEIVTNGEKVALHKANSACLYIVCTYDSSKNRLWTSVGDNCIIDMIKELHKVSEEVIKEMRHNERMHMTKDDTKNFCAAHKCYLCNGGFTKEGNLQKVKDHDHRTGAYRGAAHQKCNINYFSNRYLPVIFHNLTGYDSHFIIRQAYEIIDD